ncbi:MULTISPECIES: primosomal protein N' [unclassified Acinetobacter]|uniref:primosomal protein N' n=1 Tax=unclassified Acinetobacter TaxID=196816 RepID=UPI0035B7B131
MSELVTTTYPYRLSVAVAVHIFDLLDYIVDAEQYAQATVGARVRVPLMNKEVIGIVVKKIDASEPANYPYQLKSVLKVFKEPAILDDLCLNLLQWAANYYQAPVGEVILSTLPKSLKQGRPYHILSYHWRALAIDADDEQLAERMPKASTALGRALKAVQIHHKGTSETILNLSGVTTAQLKKLAELGLVEQYVEEIDFSPTPVTLAQLPLQANAQQQIAIDKITENLDHYQGFLLDGITGSGKTEVYLQVMQQVLEQGKQVLLLVPEIGLTPQSIERFKARFRTEIVALHSGLGDAARLKAWQKAQTGQASIILGTRLAIFCPLPRLGLIILDEEHDLSYKQQDHFRYHARDVALYRAFKQQCPIILGSATPSFESLALVQQGKLQHLTLNQRAGDAKPPSFEVLDLRIEPKQDGIATRLIKQTQEQLTLGHQVLLFINRRGYAPVLMCESCGWQADCPHCDAHFTVHYQPFAKLKCHHCGNQQAIPQVCPSCQSPTLKTIGQGTARLEESLQQHFSDFPIIRVDRDTTTKAQDWQQIYQHAHIAKPVIFLGTQMLAKGHHFPFVSLVSILNIDAGLFSSDFRAMERTAQLTIQVAGRAGRGKIHGHVLLQSLRPEHPLLQDLLQHGYAYFAQTASAERQAAHLPPYRYAVLIRAESRDEQYSQSVLQQAQQQLMQYKPQIANFDLDFWGPVSAPMSKRAGYYRANLLIFSQNRSTLQKIMTAWWQQFFKQSRQHDLRLTIDIDPQDLS